MSGSKAEATPGPDQVVEQMRDATDRLREQAWMVAPMTTIVDLTAIEAADLAGSE